MISIFYLQCQYFIIYLLLFNLLLHVALIALLN